jgi:hypothetical protein
MSGLVRLYPRAWRERYEEEFVALLDDRPPNPRDFLDTIRGALDAHLHPSLVPGGPEPAPWTHRIPGLLALTGGGLWSATVLYIASRSDPPWEAWDLLGLALMVMFLSLPGDYMFRHGRRIAYVLGVLGASIVLVNLQDWAVAVVAGLVAAFVAFGGMLALAAIRAEIDPGGRWLIVAAAVLAPVAVSLPAAVGVVRIDEGQLWYATIFLPYGLAWALVGLRMAVRGSPTIIDPPIEPEVHAA